jgi:hypothetical protein
VVTGDRFTDLTNLVIRGITLLNSGNNFIMLHVLRIGSSVLMVFEFSSFNDLPAGFGN